MKHCPYCGARIQPTAIACGSHRDLVSLDQLGTLPTPTTGSNALPPPQPPRPTTSGMA